MKAQVADVFLQKFQLKPEEIQVLRGAKSGTMSQVWKILTYSFEVKQNFTTMINILNIKTL